jgi:tetratricopeptide (TPR) repeat protein
MGCVDEPSIQFTPNVALFLSRWTINHFTYAEAAWAAQPALSWQTTVIGDPLYCPFAKTPDEDLAELRQTHNPLVDWYYLRLVDANGVRGVPLSQLEDFLENFPDTDHSAILTEKLASLCDIQGKPETAIEYYERALKLNPTPEQRIRIRLALALVLAGQNENGEAIADYQLLLKEFPAYPGADNISAKIAALQPTIGPAK